MTRMMRSTVCSTWERLEGGWVEFMKILVSWPGGVWCVGVGCGRVAQQTTRKQWRDLSINQATLLSRS
jgi:hypothetical protein